MILIVLFRVINDPMYWLIFCFEFIFGGDYLRTYEISHPYALVNIVSGLHQWVNGKNSKFFAFDSTNHVLHFHNGQLEPANKYF